MKFTGDNQSYLAKFLSLSSLLGSFDEATISSDSFEPNSNFPASSIALPHVIKTK